MELTIAIALWCGSGEYWKAKQINECRERIYACVNEKIQSAGSSTQSCFLNEKLK